MRTALLDLTTSPIRMYRSFNKERDAVNASVFNQFCMDNGPADGNVHNGALVILVDQLHVNDSGKTMVHVKSNAVKRYFWETVGESNCKTTEIRGLGWIDPLLKLYYRCPLMMMQNTTVASGKQKDHAFFSSKSVSKEEKCPL